jgi:rare lipoprotein A (peptidoglycan hydrolase)
LPEVTPGARRARRAALIVATIVALILATLAAGCGSSTRTGSTAKPRGSRPGLQRGLATWYGNSKGQHGGPTASGERFDRHKLTAAHLRLKFGTWVRVTNTKNGRSVRVRINDRGPYGNAKRIIDVSEAAARILGMIDAGVVPVTVEVLP